MSYNHKKKFNNNEVLDADELNQLIEGINGSVTNIVLGENNVTLIITNNKGDSVEIALPSGGGNINASEIVLNGLTDPQTTWTDENKAAARETIGLVGGSSYKKKIYATDGEGNFILLGYSNGVGGSDVVQRNPDGSIQVPTPAEGKELGAIHAVNWTVLQNYVNSKIGDISTSLNSILDLQEATE